jgi:hypothetical protein
MTAQELIALLQTVPPDAAVLAPRSNPVYYPAYTTGKDGALYLQPEPTPPAYVEAAAIVTAARPDRDGFTVECGEGDWQRAVILTAGRQ